MKQLKENLDLILFFLYFTFVFFSAALKNVIIYSNFIDEFILILIFLIFFLNKENFEKIIFYYKNNIFLFILIIYILCCLFFWKKFDYENLLRVKYYLMHIIFFSIISSISSFKINYEKIEKVLFILLFASMLFGLFNFVLQDNFLNFFYYDIGSLNVSYHNTNSRLVSLFGNPINFGFICNIFLIYLIYKFKLKNNFKYILILITLIILFSTFSRLAYVAFGFTFLIYLIINKKYKTILFFLILITTYALFATQIINFLLIYQGNNFFILFLKRMDDLMSLQFLGNYFQQLFVFNYLINKFSFIFLIGNGFDFLGWGGGDRFLLEFSFATILYEIGFIGLILYIIIFLDYIKNVIYNPNILDLNILIIVALYGLLNNGLIYNPYSLIFLYHYQKVKFQND